MLIAVKNIYLAAIKNQLSLMIIVDVVVCSVTRTYQLNGKKEVKRKGNSVKFDNKVIIISSSIIIIYDGYN